MESQNQAKQHYSVEKLNHPNRPPMKGSTVSEDRSHVTSGPQSASRHNTPAPAFRKVRLGKG